MINDIRVAPNELYNHGINFQTTNQKQNEITYGEIISKAPVEKDEEKNKINFSSLGAPAGFFADISMLDEKDAKEIGLIQL